jgi:hypothetical protein
MPRLTNHQHLVRRTTLHAMWAECQIAYSAAPLAQQWELHRYYQTIVDATDEELIANRKALEETEQSLSHRAGKTYAAVVQAASCYKTRAQPPTPAVPGKSKDRVITVRAVARPEPDLKKVAMALIMLAEQQAKDQDDERKAA